VIDLHTHLLPGVDDGSRSPEQTLQVLQRFAAQGVTAVACTPHLRASELDDAPCEEMDGMLGELRALWEQAGTEARGRGAAVGAAPRLLRGFEILLDLPDPAIADRCLTIHRTRYVLVEFGRLVPAEASVEALRRIAAQGVVPLLAHPERYAACSVETARAWRSAGARLQLDATTLLGESRRAVRARALLEAGLGDIIASDNHGDGRSLAAAVEWLDSHGGERQAALLAVTNPAAIVADAETEPVPAMRVRVSWYSALKGFVVGGGE
jgi:protein-tyrosine phosphatase